MGKQPSNIQLQVFSTKTLSGSAQSLIFVSDKSKLTVPPPVMKLDTDYTTAYFDGKTHVDVVWRNHFNPIQLCGSAAYGLSYYLLKTFELPKLTIQSANMTLTAESVEEVYLFLKAEPIFPAVTQPFKNGHLYHHQPSGIFFLEVEDKTLLSKSDWSDEDLYALPLQKPHGFCLFHWDQLTTTGFVRYFTPWHGRSEDSVTGSIQRYLTTHVAYQYRVNAQTWIQLSKQGGRVNTQLIGDNVRLQGHCDIPVAG